MARSVKKGLDYLPLSVSMNDRFQLLEAEFGLTGFAVVIKLYQHIYGGYGYYCEWNGDIAMMFARRNGIDRETLEAIVQAALRRGLFDAGRFEACGILTSAGIQSRYLEATGRRGAVELRSEYLLLPMEKLPRNVVIDGVPVDILPENDDAGTQRKEEETKENQRKSSSEEEETEEKQISAQSYAYRNLKNCTSGNLQELKAFCERLPGEMILHAIDEACAAGKPSFGYVRSILQRYIDEKLTSLDEVKRQEEQHRYGYANAVFAETARPGPNWLQLE